ncbi:MAG: hypothetical protein WC657_07740 [Candidatus Paceibacterota bacterium]|jgi:hypothetical protein
MTRFLILFALFLGRSLYADQVAIPDSPFSIECPPNWKVVSARPEETRGEYYPGKGIDSEVGHIHVYKRLSKTVSDAIADTQKTYKKIEGREARKMPALLKIEPFHTDNGFSGQIAFFGYRAADSEWIKEQKFYFAAKDGSIYCACMEAKHGTPWDQLRNILKSSLIENKK